MPPVLRRRGLVVLVVAVALTVSACDGLALSRNAPGGVPTGELAPELAGLADWQNSGPLTLEGLLNEQRVVLVDFWTYTCVNCLRTLPFLKQWHDKYADRGLTIIGVHTPEFEFERDPSNVRAAVTREGIAYAVAQDNERHTWDAFHNTAWPAKYLIGVDGAVRYTHLGEGDYTATERAIRSALTQAGHDVRDIKVSSLTPPARDTRANSITRELYGGYEGSYRGGVYAAQKEYYLGPNLVQDYVDPSEHAREQWYLQGQWRNLAEAVVHARTTTALEDYLAFRFLARSVNVVMHPAPDGVPYDVVVEMDGHALAADEAGEDVRIDAAGRSVVTVREPRMYSVVILPAAGDHELRLRSNASGFSMYAVTFGAYVEGA